MLSHQLTSAAIEPYKQEIPPLIKLINSGKDSTNEERQQICNTYFRLLEIYLASECHEYFFETANHLVATVNNHLIKQTSIFTLGINRDYPSYLFTLLLYNLELMHSQAHLDFPKFETDLLVPLLKISRRLDKLRPPPEGEEPLYTRILACLEFISFDKYKQYKVMDRDLNNLKSIEETLEDELSRASDFNAGKESSYLIGKMKYVNNFRYTIHPKFFKNNVDLINANYLKILHNYSLNYAYTLKFDKRLTNRKLYICIERGLKICRLVTLTPDDELLRSLAKFYDLAATLNPNTFFQAIYVRTRMRNPGPQDLELLCSNFTVSLNKNLTKNIDTILKDMESSFSMNYLHGQDSPFKNVLIAFVSESSRLLQDCHLEENENLRFKNCIAKFYDLLNVDTTPKSPEYKFAIANFKQLQSTEKRADVLNVYKKILTIKEKAIANNVNYQILLKATLEDKKYLTIDNLEPTTSSNTQPVTEKSLHQLWHEENWKLLLQRSEESIGLTISMANTMGVLLVFNDNGLVIKGVPLHENSINQQELAKFNLILAKHYWYFALAQLMHHSDDIALMYYQAFASIIEQTQAEFSSHDYCSISTGHWIIGHLLSEIDAREKEQIVAFQYSIDAMNQLVSLDDGESNFLANTYSRIFALYTNCNNLKGLADYVTLLLKSLNNAKPAHAIALYTATYAALPDFDARGQDTMTLKKLKLCQQLSKTYLNSNQYFHNSILLNLTSTNASYDFLQRFKKTLNDYSTKLTSEREFELLINFSLNLTSNLNNYADFFIPMIVSKLDEILKSLLLEHIAGLSDDSSSKVKTCYEQTIDFCKKHKNVSVELKSLMKSYQLFECVKKTTQEKKSSSEVQQINKQIMTLDFNSVEAGLQLESVSYQLPNTQIDKDPEEFTHYFDDESQLGTERTEELLSITKVFMHAHSSTDTDKIKLLDTYLREIGQKNGDEFSDSKDSFEAITKNIYHLADKSKPAIAPKICTISISDIVNALDNPSLAHGMYQVINLRYKPKTVATTVDDNLIFRPLSQPVIVAQSPPQTFPLEPTESKRPLKPAKESRKELQEKLYNEHLAAKHAEKKAAEEIAARQKVEEEENKQKAKLKFLAEKAREKSEREARHKENVEKTKKRQEEIVNTVTKVQKDCLDQTFLKLFQIRELKNMRTPNDLLPNDDKVTNTVISDTVKHYALLYNLFRCFQMLKTYKDEFYKNTKLKKKAESRSEQKLYEGLNHLRHSIIHRGAEVTSFDDIINTTDEILSKVPPKFLMSNAEGSINFWSASLTEAQRKDWICEFGFSNGRYKVSECQLTLEDTDLYVKLQEFNRDLGDKQDTSAELHKMILDIYIPKIWEIINSIDKKNIGIAGFKDLYNKKADIFNNSYFFHLQALRMLVTICGELSQAFNKTPDKAFKKFIDYCRLVRNEVGHEIDDFHCVHKPDFDFFNQLRAYLLNMNTVKVGAEQKKSAPVTEAPKTSLRVSAKEFVPSSQETKPVAIQPQPVAPSQPMPMMNNYLQPQSFYLSPIYQQVGFYSQQPHLEGVKSPHSTFSLK